MTREDANSMLFNEDRRKFLASISLAVSVAALAALVVGVVLLGPGSVAEAGPLAPDAGAAVQQLGATTSASL